ncbi:Por secretion system C-terminal sorting domain-containing protein [Formosa sp. Hel1_31_208]|uniref:FG-GAP-like repeat-containing protein n=1 Tax=Formosa sp. Hel1_31_208 TaxID=1798225 RepID=UPI00087CFB50|nr:FG-GAP-like repeat-containing protein [Formosa sp. Hel1_31_208]SDR72498.1 Por secretion system C-terminal sorting domain-containing protein [Formosa sp. Hel1_31_208]
MKKITLLLFVLSAFCGFSQTLNQPANWPNNNWSITGNYIATSDAFEANPTVDNSFAFDDDDAGNNHADTIAAESPTINLTAASASGENWISVGSSYVFHSLGGLLQLQYWDADANNWIVWGSTLSGTTTNVNDNFCSGNPVGFTSDILDISSFSANQLTNFRYRISYDDSPVGGFWDWGFCFQSPTISSQTAPACPNITSLSASNVNMDSVELYWQAGSSETSWEVVLQSPGLGIPSGSGTATSSNNPYSISSLTPGTSYEVYVRGYCGGTDYSNWVGPLTFTTLSPARVNFITEPMPISGYDLTVVDMNGDHLDDIVSVTNTNVNIHYQLMGGGFNEVNITTPNANYMPTWSMAAADYDRNGYTDLLYGNGSGVTFMRANNTGTGFTESSGSQYVFSQRSNFADINNDGHLDAFVCHDVAPNVYYINDGSGNLTFYQSNVTAGAPVNLGDYPSGGNYGSIWIDYDNDRDLDMFIAKCGGETDRRRNNMLTNNGDGTYTENAAALGLDDPMQTWSSSWGDYDNDGDMDLFVGASSGGHKLLRNDGSGTFVDVTAGANVSSAPTGHENVSHDFDNDGFLDIACNGTIMYGKGDMTFEDLDSSQIDYKNGSFGDLNNDGFIDTYYNGILYRNATTPNNWIKINTVGVVSNIDGIGARVELYTNAGVQVRDVRSGEGFEYMSTMNTHFGIGTETTINSIVIYWPSGIIDTVNNPTINTPIEVVEGATLSLENSFVNDLVIYPNPTKVLLNISSTDNLTDAIYTIFDINGKRIMNAKLTQNTIDVSELTTGNYILRIVSGNSIKSQKFIKQ